MPRHARFIASATASIALVVASCATLDTAAPTPAPSAQPTARPTTISTTRPTGSPVPASTPVPSETALTALPEGGSNVFAGRYTTNLTPALTLTVDRPVNIDCAPGYRCRGDVNVNLPNWLDLEFGHDHPIEIHVMSFDQVFAPSESHSLIPPPADLAAWIGDMPGVTVVSPTPVEIGGLPATQLDVQTLDEDVAFGPTGLTDVPTLGFGSHQLHRVDVLEVDGHVVVIARGIIRDEDNTTDRVAAAAAMLQPIVDSIAWQ